MGLYNRRLIIWNKDANPAQLLWKGKKLRSTMSFYYETFIFNHMFKANSTHVQIQLPFKKKV